MKATFSPLFETFADAVDWRPAHMDALCFQMVYKTRARRRWRARWLDLEVEPQFTRRALLFIDTFNSPSSNTRAHTSDIGS